MKNWLDEYEPAPSDATRVNRTVIPKDVLLKGRVTQQQLDERVANDRRKRIADSNSAKNEKYTSKNWKSKLARETQATGDKLRRSPYPNFFDDYINPAAMIGNMASGLGQVPLDIEQGNYGQAALNVALPLATGALAGIGAKTTGQFVNNLVNPLAGTSDLVNNLGNKHLSNLNKISINPSGIFDEYLHGFRQGVHEQIRGLKGLSKRRPFFETFPITKNQKAKIIALQDKAFSDAKKFTEDYWYGGNSTMRPKLKEKIQELLPDIESDVNMHNLDKESSPFVTSKDLLIPSTYSTKGRENLSEEMIDYLNKHRGVIGGVNSNGLSITLRNSGFYHKTPREIANTVVHEAGHTGQKFGYYDYLKDPNGPYYFSKKQWSDQLSQFDPNYGYFTSNPDTEIGRRFQKALVDPKIGEGNARYTYETWKSSPSELHSELMAAKHNLYKKGLDAGLSHEEMMERVTNPGEKELNWLLNHKNIDINKHFKETTPLKEKLELLKILPAAIPTTVGIGLATQQKQQEGGIVNKYENGGDVKSIQDYGEDKKPKKSANKEVKPIIVNDKNDYRLKKYQDSLYVYNKFNKLYNDLLVQGKQGNKGVVEQIRDKMSPKEIDYFGDLGLPHSYKGLKPDYVLGTKTPRENRGYLPHYKKPKQPVIYEKPIPVIDVTKEDVKVENPPVIKSELENNGYGWVRDLQTNEVHRFHPITGELEYPFKGGQTHVNPKNPKNNSKLKMNMGGSLPGVTGMMYARTGAPSNGKYAKKTKPSAEDGIKAKKENSFLEDLYSNLNPYNWGVKDYSKHKDFNTAFDKARKSNEEEFMWNGKRYNTRKDDDYIPVIGDTKDKRYSKYIREEYPEFNKVLNRGRNASKIVRKGLNLFGNKNRAYIVGSKIYAGSQASPIEFLDNVIAESGHLKSQYSNLFNLAKERLLYGEDVYNTPNTKEFYDHRLVEPAMRILADGNLSPKDIKRIQKFLGVTQDGYLGPVTYEAIKNKYKDDPYLKDLLVHENNKDYPFIDNTLSEIYLNRLNEDVPLKQINRFKDNISFPMNYSDDALLNESVSNMDIKYLQQSLKNRDYGLPNSHKYGILLDGILGKETQAALEDWRNKQKLNKKKKQGGVVNKLKNGGDVNYNQLVNFTNYNKPTSGGWLDEI
jgi:hypothetical protein